MLLGGGVVLGEAAGRVVPGYGASIRGSGAEDVEDVVGLFEAGDACADAPVVLELVVELVEFVLDVGALGQHGGGVPVGEL